MVRTRTTPPRKRRPAGCKTKSGNLRVAALSDIHGNLPALEAVLSEVERDRPDLIVSCGDVASGPMPAETISLLMSLPRARFVRGNADRGLADAFDRKPKGRMRSEEHTSELQSLAYLVCRLLLEKKKKHNDE